MFRSRFRGRSNRPNGSTRYGRKITPQEEIITKIKASQNQAFQAKISDVPIVEESTGTFAELPLSDLLKANILKKGYEHPTPIQFQTIPLIVAGKDIIGVANTGTGKTAAFLLPLIDKVIQNEEEKVLILAPTRELAVQIMRELYELSTGCTFRMALLIGGVSYDRQRRDLSHNPSFIVATPGRLKDFVRSGELSLGIFNSVVLDEADRMVDIGFINDIRHIISLLPKERHSLFFSATISGKVREILDVFVKNPQIVSVKKQETASSIQQEIVQVPDKSRKIDQLHDLLTKEAFRKVLVFGRTKWGIEKLVKELQNRGFRAGAIHGNKRQSQRQGILDKFHKNEISVLLATDVASRGLDIQGVSHVINYDLPASYEDYVHRIGRTGRASAKGVALTFVD